MKKIVSVVLLALCSIFCLMTLSSLSHAEETSPMSIESFSASLPSTPSAASVPAAGTSDITAVATLAAAAISGEAIPVVSGEATAIAGTPDAAALISQEVKARTKLLPAEGYKGVPWGATFDIFKEVKSYNGSEENPSNKVLISEANMDIAVALGAKIAQDKRTKEPKVLSRSIPNRFKAVNLDDVSYVFYNGAFAFATSFMEPQNYGKYLSLLTKKYTKLNTTTKTIDDKNGKHEFTVTLFDKEKAKVFLIKTVANVRNDISTKARVVYIGDEYFSKIRNDISEEVQQKKTIENDMDKLE